MNLSESNFIWINGIADYYRNTADGGLVHEMCKPLRRLIAWIERNITGRASLSARKAASSGSTGPRWNAGPIR